MHMHVGREGSGVIQELLLYAGLSQYFTSQFIFQYTSLKVVNLWEARGLKRIIPRTPELLLYYVYGNMSCV
jgi:hypothetical protein